MSSNQLIPQTASFRQPAEWDKQEAVWLAWPWDEKLWGEDLSGAQKAVNEFALAIVQGGTVVHLLVPPPSFSGNNIHYKKNLPQQLGLPETRLKIVEIPFGDIWLRDIGPVFVMNNNKQIASVGFQFNGWGGKYVLQGDREVALQIAQSQNLKYFEAPLVCEGGALESNGRGLALTTRQCLLNANRNPKLKAPEIEAILRQYLGFEKVIWLNEGLRNDHTDGHIDNLARFIGPDRILCTQGESGDPNAAIYAEILTSLKKATDISGQNLEVLTLPSPGAVKDDSGQLMAASYLNFLISNQAVVVPLFGSVQDERILKMFEEFFPGKKIFGVFSKILLTGGGTLHCISQQQPAIS